MSEKEPWRPPLAPKPTLPAFRTVERDASPAVRGASLAFSPRNQKPVSATQNHNSSSNAALAAAAAGRGRLRQADRDGHGVRAGVSPVRGRSQLTIDLDQAARSLERSPKASYATNAPPPSRTASELAARAASSNTSPARNSDSTPSRGPSPQRKFQRSLLQNVPDVARGRTEHNRDDALRGAAASMSANPTPIPPSPFSNSSGKLDLHRIPSLAPPSAQNSSPNQLSHLAGTAAARTASSGAETRLKEASRVAHLNFPPQRTFRPPLQRAPSTISSVSGGSKPPTPSADPADSMQKSFSEGEETTSKATKHLLSAPVPPAPRNKSPMPAATGATPRNDSGGMTVDKLADAMVASTLASSRVQSPAPSRRPKAPPVPLRRSRSLQARESGSPRSNAPLKPMPVRPMRQTMRKHSPKDEEEEEAKRGRKHLLRKHPNMHHEGDRKRWRDKITERERKRYEGVWAANRGLLYQHESADLTRQRSKGAVAEDLVVNVVVKDVWERSRLPRDVLEEVWDLVTDEGNTSLSREEFVVGMWLIDQRLKGRKLPVKVSPSVWSSVRHTQGVKIRSKPL